ncbi:MAG: hypothetical protein ABS87_04335 [Sphingomonas sp. SCN 67-18]|nr:MAG: hypothetical protein ABS87_04335 [Sphingomonas sp. SCN 67-18]
MSSAVDRSLIVEVSDVAAEARDVMRLELRPTGGAMLPPFQPGAHVEIGLPGGLVRHYSLVNDWRETDRYVIAVSRTVDSRGGSDFLHTGVRRGMKLKISAPRNNFSLNPEAGRYLFVAGGIGITPIMAMIHWCDANEKPWRLIYAARSRQRAAFFEDLSFGADSHRIRFHFKEEKRASLDIAAALQGLEADEHIYCCGPASLMQAVRDNSADRPAGTVRFEWFTAPDDPAAGSDDDEFTVTLKRDGRTLTVQPGASILEVLEGNGLVVPYSCREGLCGTCRTTVLAGQPDHRDYVLTDEEREAGTAMMLCVSRALSPDIVLDL